MQAVAEAIVRVSHCSLWASDGNQAVGSIVGVGINSVREQIAVVVAGVGDASSDGQTCILSCLLNL